MIGASDHSCAYLVALGHQKADAVGGAHPSTVDTVQRCALPLFVVGNSDVFYNVQPSSCEGDQTRALTQTYLGTVGG